MNTVDFWIDLPNLNTNLNSKTKLYEYIDWLELDYKWELEYLISQQNNQIKKDCKISINIPVFREGKNIYKTLFLFTQKQLNSFWNPINSDIFEINILLNSPNQNIDVDDETKNEILRFKKDFPNYNINLFIKQFNFNNKAKIWTIFKTLVDISILRSREINNDLIIRISWADLDGISFKFINDTLNVFKNEKVSLYRSEYILPREVLEVFPLLHIMHFISISLLRVYNKWNILNWWFSFLSSSYCEVGWFNKDLHVWEEMDLAVRIMKSCKTNNDKTIVKNLLKHVINNPRRQIHAILQNWNMANRYNNFWKLDNENTLRNFENEFNISSLEQLPIHAVLNEENLTREINNYFIVYFKKINIWEKLNEEETFEKTKKLFERILMFAWFSNNDYEISFCNEHKNFLKIKNLNNIKTLIERRLFNWYEDFDNI